MSLYFDVIGETGDTKIGEGTIDESAMFQCFTGEQPKGSIPFPYVDDPTIITNPINGLTVWKTEEEKIKIFNAGNTATGVFRQVGFADKLITLVNPTGNYEWDMFDGNFSILTLTANSTLDDPMNFFDGDIAHLILAQDAAGAHVFTPPGAWKFPGGAYTLSPGANAQDILTVICTGEEVYVSSISANVS